MSERIYWNYGWQFTGAMTEDPAAFPEEQWAQAEQVVLPHTPRELPLHYFDESSYQLLMGYRRAFFAPEAWRGCHVLLTVEAAGHSAALYLNGVRLCEHHCGYTAFTVDLAPALRIGETNTLLLQVDSREQQNQPPFGLVVDYMTFGGLYREVYVEITGPAFIRDVFVKTTRQEDGSYLLIPETDCCIPEGDGDRYSLRQRILSDTGRELGTLDPRARQHMIRDLQEWSVDSPTLYLLKTELLHGPEQEVVDEKTVRFGFREAVFKADGFYLNGKKLKLRGLNRHQCYPYVGYAMPKSIQSFDAEVLKRELGLNAVRTSHYPQSQHFIDRCDELGLLVFTEIPGWQHIGDEAWKAQAVENTKAMVLQYRNHPSIILWGVRINESQDDDEFYSRTNAVAHELDPTRQTGGVRYLQKSSLLEDVYTYNDFSHNGTNDGCMKKRAVTPDPTKGYLISEYNGHMFPTKAFDPEDHRTEHLLRHAKVLDAVYGEPDIAGSFGWCMADYNTHRDFGSGDRVCYHGVLDQFRNPKPAAALYRSQQEAEPVLEISSAMEIGEHPACLIRDVYAVTNADSVRFYRNDIFIREFFADASPYRNLPHGPICINDLIGDYMEQQEGFDHKKAEEVKSILMDAGRYGLANLPVRTKALAAKCMVRYGMTMSDAVTLYNKYMGSWGGTATVYRFEAIKDGRVVKTVVKQPAKRGHLEVSCSATALREEHSWDAAAVRIRLLSEDGNLLSFSNAPLTLETSGAIELIGPKTIALAGGMGGTYVRTAGRSGSGSLHIDGGCFGTVTIEFTAEAAQATACDA